MKRFILTAIPFLFAVSIVSGSAKFESQILPILETKCFKCHGQDKQKSDLRLDSVTGINKGGNSGEPLFVRGNSSKSLIAHLINSDDLEERMPPEGETELTIEERALISEWIDAGAQMPLPEKVIELSTDHWSFQPVQRPKIPELKGDWANNEIDSFILEKMLSKDLSPSTVSESRKLIRRIYQVMHGLPPSDDMVKRHLKQIANDDWSEVVNEVLASPHYGERFARHWLDIVRFAETNGFETNRERLTAYYFRDYVIRSFNEDQPYDRFIIEQLAGDESGVDVGTGFLVAGPHDIVKSPDINLTLMQRNDEMADMINTTGTAFLGLTIGCARCHNHKFDPILQKDYYSMQAVFSGVRYGERMMPKKNNEVAKKALVELEEKVHFMSQELDSLKLLSSKVKAEGTVNAIKREAVNALGNTEIVDEIQTKHVRFTVLRTNSGQPCIDELRVFNDEGQNVALAKNGARLESSGNLKGYEIHKLEHINDGKDGNPRSWISDTVGTGWVKIDFAKASKINRIEWARDREGNLSDRLAIDYIIEHSLDGQSWHKIASSEDREPYGGAIAAKDAFLSFLSDKDAGRGRKLILNLQRTRNEISSYRNGSKAWVAKFEKPGKTHRLYRGDPMAKREVVAPDTLKILGSLKMSEDEDEQQRRLKLAQSIASKKNPLTARVMVNRLWQFVFGVGIVDTPSDLGTNGTGPTHPQLLDWLASEFMRNDWSIKHMLSLILCSDTFRQSSRPRDEALKIDAGSRYLWRFPPRRLEAEAIRDSILAVAGTLDLNMGGPGFYLLDVDRENVVHYHPKEKTGPEEWRRMIYMFKIRQEQDLIFGAFDCPDGNQVIPERSRSTTPIQALNLFNSHFMIQQSGKMADKLLQEAGDSVEEQVRTAYQLYYGRPTLVEEINDATAFVRDHSLADFCRAMFNSNEFLFTF
ncbi:MAG TPA: DUF1553 domain-containing protein [Verrucomicrobia bacterium]|nr:DUF1553 domain-containing protein [Verrucomicrobiales bacterium]HIL56047.1 DUF1553 domain-containing protein [Verrucomicrobiota bacterium]